MIWRNCKPAKARSLAACRPLDPTKSAASAGAASRNICTILSSAPAPTNSAWRCLETHSRSIRCGPKYRPGGLDLTADQCQSLTAYVASLQPPQEVEPR